MSRVCRWLAILSAVFSAAAFLLALWGGSLLLAMHGLLAAIGLLAGQQEGVPYPLGVWIYPLYLIGFAVSLAALRHPRWAGIAMVPLGLCAALFGGPVALVYGSYLVVAGFALAALSASRDVETRRVTPG